MVDAQPYDAAVGCELHGIGQQIDDDLLHGACVSPQRDAHPGRGIVDPHAAVRRTRFQHGNAGPHHHAKLHDLVRKLIAACLDLREIEHVIDHVEQMMAG